MLHRHTGVFHPWRNRARRYAYGTAVLLLALAGSAAAQAVDAPSTEAPRAAAQPEPDMPASLDLASRYGKAAIYPGQAYRDGLEGEVIVVCQVAADGTLVDAVVATSSGWPVLDEAALVAVRKWRYNPGRKDGVPVPGQVRIPVSFKQP